MLNKATVKLLRVVVPMGLVVGASMELFMIFVPFGGRTFCKERFTLYIPKTCEYFVDDVARENRADKMVRNEQIDYNKVTKEKL